MRKGGSDTYNNSDIKEDLIFVKRVSNVVKGGRRFSFSALVVAGDGMSRVGYGFGKDNEVIGSRSKASRDARKRMIKVPLREGRTIHCRMEYKYGATKVVLMPAPLGAGIRASSSIRPLFERLGITDIAAKCHGSSSKANLIKAAYYCLKNSCSPKSIAEKRGKKISEIIERKNS